MKNNVEILEKDFERYTVQLPWTAIIKGKSKKYIYSELEKKHPCFSDECYYEGKNHLKKSGIESDVVVMNKFTLAEYKQRFPGKKFWLENVKGRTFASKEIKKIYLLVILFVFLVWVVIATNVFSSKKNIDILEDEIIESEIDSVRSDAISAFLDFVEKNNGRFSSLTWTCDGRFEVFKASVSNIYPEQMEMQFFNSNLQIGNVNYVNGKPCLFVTVKDVAVNKDKTVEQNNEKKEAQNFVSVRALIRQVFKDFNIDLQEEKINQLGFRFLCGKYCEIKGENFLSALDEVCKKYDIGISFLELNRVENNTGADGFTGQIVFDEKLNGNYIKVEPLAWRTNLIFEKRKTVLQSQNFVTPKNTAVGELIGEILRNDGSRIRFYKNAQGKMIKEEIK